MRNQLVRRPQNFLDTFFNDDIFQGFTYGKDIDIYRKDNNYVVEADIPGFDKKDISIDFKGDVLTLTAEHTEENEDKGDKNYYYRSRQMRRFTRQIRFNDVDATKIDAAYEKGVLKVTLPILHEDKVDSRRIEVK